MVRVQIKIFALLVVVIAVSGCGVYTFNPRGKSDYNSIAVIRFENQTPEYGLSDRITDQIIDAFISDGTFRVLPEGSADVVLIGVLSRYDRRASTYDENNQVLTYRVDMDFNITLRNPVDGTDIWTERMSQYGTYDLATETEEDGQKIAIELLIGNIINKSTKSW